jgi:hypothetical protein
MKLGPGQSLGATILKICYFSSRLTQLYRYLYRPWAVRINNWGSISAEMEHEEAGVGGEGSLFNVGLGLLAEGAAE